MVFSSTSITCFCRYKFTFDQRVNRIPQVLNNFQALAAWKNRPRDNPKRFNLKVSVSRSSHLSRPHAVFPKATNNIDACRGHAMTLREFFAGFRRWQNIVLIREPHVERWQQKDTDDQIGEQASDNHDGKRPLRI